MCHLDPSRRLATIDMGQKLSDGGCAFCILVLPPVWPQRTLAENWGAAVPLYGRRAWFPSKTISRRPRPTSVPSGILIIIPFGHNRHGPKIAEGSLPPFREGGAGSPSNTMSSGLRPTSVPSSILIHVAVRPQKTWTENWGGAPPPFWGRRLGPHRTQSPLG